jgi:2-polyprenyl-3-methyl-5-hydroxy-6-metoxy-1,4-benzoquinol methylase
MTIILRHDDGEVEVSEALANGCRQIFVRRKSESVFVPKEQCESAYPLELIDLILKVKGVRYLCDEIMRDESPSYVQHVLTWTILGHISEAELDGKLILDFGCGAGASTMILARMFSESEIVGVDMDSTLLAIAAARLRHYGYKNVRLHQSPGGTELPQQLPICDFIVFNGVYEHLLPSEREALIPRIWALLRPGGVMFIGETPHRYSPWEFHTTRVPFLNYLPDKVALHFAQRFSKRVRSNESWQELLRRGIRGATEREIMAALNAAGHGKPILLSPHRLGLRDKYDLWYSISTANPPMTLKRYLEWIFRKIGTVGIDFVPYLALAVKKESVPRH